MTDKLQCFPVASKECLQILRLIPPIKITFFIHIHETTVPLFGQRVIHAIIMLWSVSSGSSTTPGYHRPSTRRDRDKPDQSVQIENSCSRCLSESSPDTDNYQKRCCYHYNHSSHTSDDGLSKRAGGTTRKCRSESWTILLPTINRPRPRLQHHELYRWRRSTDSGAMARAFSHSCVWFSLTDSLSCLLVSHRVLRPMNVGERNSDHNTTTGSSTGALEMTQYLTFSIYNCCGIVWKFCTAL